MNGRRNSTNCAVALLDQIGTAPPKGGAVLVAGGVLARMATATIMGSILVGPLKSVSTLSM